MLMTTRFRGESYANRPRAVCVGSREVAERSGNPVIVTVDAPGEDESYATGQTYEALVSGLLPDITSMSLGDCSDCLLFFQDVTHTSKRQMAAIAEYDSAVQRDANEKELFDLKQQVDFWAVQRRRAMDRYTLHQLKRHEENALPA